MRKQRVDKINYYLDIAEAVANRSTCLRKKCGSAIVKNDEIIATGYNGAPRGRENCIDLGYCTKKKLLPDIRHSGYDACRSVHAEQNAIISAARKDMIGGDLYLVVYRTDSHEYEEGVSCCLLCRKLIINAGIKRVIVRINQNEYKVVDVEDWIKADEFIQGKLQY